MSTSRPPFELKLVNDATGDPAMHVFFPKLGEAILFDLGHLENLSNRELLKVRKAFVSHAHIDHFIGFDRLLRVNIPHGKTLELCGPKGFIENVKGKLAAYTWNLLQPGQIQIIVHELRESGKKKSVILKNDHKFVPEDFVQEPNDFASFLPDGSVGIYVTGIQDKVFVKAIILDHGIPVVAYLCQMPGRYQVMTEELERLNLSPGPWIRELQLALANEEKDRLIDVNGISYIAEELGNKILQPLSAKPLAYLTDFSFCQENIKKIIPLMSGVSLMLIESCFCDEDRKEAFAKSHLTTKQAALIAALCKAEKLVTFHFSNIYLDQVEQVKEEVQGFFRKFSSLTEEVLKKEMEFELKTPVRD